MYKGDEDFYDWMAEPESVFNVSVCARDKYSKRAEKEMRDFGERSHVVLTCHEKSLKKGRRLQRYFANYLQAKTPEEECFVSTLAVLMFDGSFEHFPGRMLMARAADRLSISDLADRDGRVAIVGLQLINHIDDMMAEKVGWCYNLVQWRLGTIQVYKIAFERIIAQG